MSVYAYRTRHSESHCEVIVKIFLRDWQAKTRKCAAYSSQISLMPRYFSCLNIFRCGKLEDSTKRLQQDSEESVMAINKKVLTGFFILLALLLIISSLSIFQMSRMGDHSKEIKENWVPSLSLISEINVLDTNVPRWSTGLGWNLIRKKFPSCSPSFKCFRSESTNRQWSMKS